MILQNTAVSFWIYLAAAVCYAAADCVYCAFGDLSGGRVRKLEETDPAFARKLDAWLENETPIQTFLKLVLCLCSILMGLSLAAPALAASASGRIGFPAAYAVFAAATLMLLCIISELLSRMLLTHHDLAILRYFMPLTAFMTDLALSALKPLFKAVKRHAEKWREQVSPEEKATVEDEILDLMEDKPDGELEEGEKRMIKGIFELQDKSVREIMTPRVDMVALPLSSSIEEAKKIIIESGHSRIPVYGKSIDEIKGIIYAKDFLTLPNDKRTLAGMTHQPIFIPETKAVDELLNEIKRTRNHFAVIIDEYGGTSGIVTFEDIIEEIVGDVFDEYDAAEAEADRPRVQPDGSIELEARVTLSELGEILDTDLPEDDSSDTIGGYICTTLGRIPEEGEIFLSPDHRFQAKILTADKRKIEKLKINLTEQENEG